MLRVFYYALAAPVALGVSAAASETAPIPVTVGCAVLVLASATWPGLAHPRYKGRMHPGAALVRGSAYVGYMLRTSQDRDRGNLDRGPSYCLEWCAVVGLIVGVVTSQIPPLAGWAWWWGGAVAVGCAAHVLADWITPTGVPLSAVWNVLRHREVWRRHSLGWSSTDTAGDMFLAVPVLFALTGVVGLAMLGWLGPLVAALVGWS